MRPSRIQVSAYADRCSKCRPLQIRRESEISKQMDHWKGVTSSKGQGRTRTQCSKISPTRQNRRRPTRSQWAKSERPTACSRLFSSSTPWSTWPDWGGHSTLQWERVGCAPCCWLVSVDWISVRVSEMIQMLHECFISCLSYQSTSIAPTVGSSRHSSAHPV